VDLYNVAEEAVRKWETAPNIAHNLNITLSSILGTDVYTSISGPEDKLHNET
jgi:hypothetical protein